MADALPDDPVARAKAIALKLTATAAPGPEEFGNSAPSVDPLQGSTPASESGG